MEEIQTASLSHWFMKYYVYRLQWLSELEFFQSELGFLIDLIGDYAPRMADTPARLKKLAKCENEFGKLHEAIMLVIKKLRYQVDFLEGAAATAANDEAAERLVAIEAEICQIKSNFRSRKSELYSLLGILINETRSFAG